MIRTRAALADAVRPFATGGHLQAAHMPSFNAFADALGLPDDSDAPPAPVIADRLTIADLQDRLGVLSDGLWGPASKAALRSRLTNRSAPAITHADIIGFAKARGLRPETVRGVRKVEAPRGAYDDAGMPSMLYERHVFSRNTVPAGRLDALHSALSGKPYGPGGYGSYGAQYGKLEQACGLDPEAAFRAVSWGAFQVLGENAVAIGYPSAFDMAMELVTGEVAHLKCFGRFLEANELLDELRTCRPGDPESCIPFVSKYNGPGFARFDYHIKLAKAIR